MAPGLSLNIYTLCDIIKCARCHRVVGKVLNDGNYEFFSIRLVRWQTTHLNLDSDLGYEVLTKTLTENRSLLGKYSSHKRCSEKIDHDEPLAKKLKLDTDVQCFRVALQYENEVTPAPFENFPIFFEEEDEVESDLLVPMREQSNIIDEDVFFNQETIPFLLNGNELPDYESIASDNAYFPQSYFSPYRFSDASMDFNDRPFMSPFQYPESFFESHSLSDGIFSSDSRFDEFDDQPYSVVLNPFDFVNEIYDISASSFNYDEELMDVPTPNSTYSYFSDIANNTIIYEPSPESRE